MAEHGLKNLQRIIRRKGLGGFFVDNIVNVRYLTGFTGSSGFVLVTGDRGIFFTDFRYREQAEAEVGGFEIAIEKGKRINVLRDVVRKLGLGKLGFETSVSYGFYEQMSKFMALAPQKNLVEDLRILKSEEEIVSIKKAIARAEKAFLGIKPLIRVGSREREIALRLEERLKKEGCVRIPFDTIVASGRHSSMPHAKPTEKRLEAGDFVIIDWGGEDHGYFSDMTRTLLMAGKDLSAKRKIYDVVDDARKKAVARVRDGIQSSAVDGAARSLIKEAGYGEFFGHGTGHGVGLDVHERPRVSWTGGERLAEGMVFTVEPGIYVPGLGGVRIEDMVRVRAGKGKLLTTLSRELEIIGS